MLKLISASKIYDSSGVTALRRIDLHVARGDYVSVTGASGSGKSTLMHILGLLDTLSAGSYLLCGTDVSHLSPAALAARRASEIGFVFQQFQLLPGLTALENTALPLAIGGIPRSVRLARAPVCCSRTSRLRASTRSPPPMCSRCSTACTSAATPSSSSRMTRRPPGAPRAVSVWKTAYSLTYNKYPCKKGENPMNRRDKTNYYLDMAQVALERGTCLRRNFGAVIVKNDVIVSTGYTGAPRGRANCIDIGTCVRQKMGIPRGERYEFCRSVHAEANAIIAAPREQMLGATLYLVGRDMSTGEIMRDANSCTMCKRMIINAGISQVIIRRDNDTYDTIDVADWVAHDDVLDGQTGY